MAHDKAKAKARARPVRSEVLRMVSSGVGSLDAEADLSDQWRDGAAGGSGSATGDSTRGLKARRRQRGARSWEGQLLKNERVSAG